MHYIEYLTKFQISRPLETKSAIEVSNLFLFKFLGLGVPHILQSDNGREFTAQIIQELSTLWPELFLVNGGPRHPHCHDSVERSNSDMKNKLMYWNNNSKCRYGIHFVQLYMNTSYREAIRMEPYEALTGNKPRCGLISILPTDLIEKIATGISEEDLEHQIRNVENKDMSCNNPENIAKFTKMNLIQSLCLH